MNIRKNHFIEDPFKVINRESDYIWAWLTKESSTKIKVQLLADVSIV